jgi:hypothetical protein
VRPILFLDIDGVLAHFGTSDELDPACIARLDGVLVRTRAKVMLTSAWRDRHGVDGTEQRLVAAGFRGRLTGAIPSLPGRSRSEEIKAYLNTVSRSIRFAILDHIPLARELLPHLVRVDDVVGLSADDVARAERIILSRYGPRPSPGLARKAQS